MTLILVPTIAQAALESYILLEPLPCVPNTKSANDTTCATLGVTNMPLEDYIDYVFKFSIALAAFLAVIVIIWGGFEYMTTESFSGKGNAKKRIQGALTGLLMVLASYLILRTIDPRLVEINTSIPKIVIDTSDVGEFNAILSANLKKMTLDDIKNVNILENTKKVIQSKIDKLLYDVKGDERKLSLEKIAELAELRQEFNTKDTEQEALIVRGVAKTDFYTAIDFYDDAYGYFKNATMKDEISELILDQKKAIGNKYDDIISNLNGNTDAVLIQQLNTEKTFYLKEIDNGVRFSTDLVNYSVSKTPDGKSVMEIYQEKYRKEVDILKAITPPASGSEKIIYNEKLDIYETRLKSVEKILR
jgi:hypothetical protein